jgi:hypothetical protein
MKPIKKEKKEKEDREPKKSTRRDGGHTNIKKST